MIETFDAQHAYRSVCVFFLISAAVTSHQTVAAYTSPTIPRAVGNRRASTYIPPLLGSVVDGVWGSECCFVILWRPYHHSRGQALSDVRSSPASSRFSLIAIFVPFRATGGATGTNVPSASNSLDSNREMFNSKLREQRRVNAQKG